MELRKVKDAKDLDTGELVYFKSHARATYLSNGMTVEDAIFSGFSTNNGNVSISLASNQNNADVLHKVVSVSDGVSTKRYLYSGTPIEMPLKANVEYTVMFNDIKGYKTPESQTFTLGLGDTHSIVGLYEAQVLDLNVLGIDSGFEIQVNDSAIQTTTNHRYYIPFGETVTITSSKIDGYLEPKVITYVANETYKSIDLRYIYLLEGVFIQSTDGRLWSSTTWSNDLVAEGIYVGNASHKFIISLTDIASVAMYSSTSPTASLSTGYSTTTYNGKTNTDVLLSTFGNNNSYASAKAYTTISPSGKNGYIGSVGEWNMVQTNITAINNLLTLLGVTTVSGNYWTSSRYSSYRYYDYDGALSSSDYTSQSSSLKVRPFYTIN